MSDENVPVLSIPKFGRLTDVKLIDVTIIGGSISNVTLNNVTINNSTMNNSNIVNSNITGGTMNGTTLTNVTINTPTINGGTITGSTLINVTLTSPTITNPTVTGGTFSNPTLITNPIFSGGTFNSVTFNTPTVNNPTLNSATVNGSMIFQNGFIISQTGPGPTLNLDGNINFGSVPGSPNVNLDFTNATTIVGLVRTASIITGNSVTQPYNNVVQVRLDLCRIDKMVIMRCSGNLNDTAQFTDNFLWSNAVPLDFRANQNICYACPTEFVQDLSPAPSCRFYDSKAIIANNGDLTVAGGYEVGQNVFMNAGWTMSWWLGPFL